RCAEPADRLWGDEEVDLIDESRPKQSAIEPATRRRHDTGDAETFPHPAECGAEIHPLVADHEVRDAFSAQVGEVRRGRGPGDQHEDVPLAGALRLPAHAAAAVDGCEPLLVTGPLDDLLGK